MFPLYKGGGVHYIRKFIDVGHVSVRTLDAIVSV